MWLGPRAYQPYQYNIAPYKFRWWRAYSSQNGNWGIYAFDVMRWLMAVEAPVAITANSSKLILKDDRTIPDTSEITCETASGAVMIFGMYEANGGPMIDGGGEIELRGTKGNLIIGERRGYKIVPSRPGQFQDRGPLTEAVEKTAGSEQFSRTDVVSNFLDCIKTRNKPFCDLETGHRSNTFSLLANIAEVAKTRIEWDPKTEKITNNSDANKLLHYEYQKPWTVD
jgi:predicted dehydrogenase